MSSNRPDSATEGGSYWRRWDPHVHLPGTVLNDQYGDVSVGEALDQLAQRVPAIEAVGVTDYGTTASYRRAVEAHSDGHGRGIRLLFPNVELRLDNATSKNHGVNLHLICSPEDVDNLDDFVASLRFSWADGRYSGNPAGLIRLGRDFTDNQHLDDVAALEAGYNIFKVNFELLREAIKADKWARHSLLIAVAASSNDGTAGLQSEDGSMDGRRQSIENLAHIIFSGSPRQAQFWLGHGGDSLAELTRKYGGQKVCLHGSDGHDMARLGTPDQNRYCWLKGDPSFDTLRLACVAPETRAHIGPEPPVAASHGRVVRVAVPDADWFPNETIDLNPGLIAIIGSRGSGKTALADLIAAGAGSSDPFSNPASFIRRAGSLLHRSNVLVDWSQDELTVCNFADGIPGRPYLRPVRYLSQQFVERLCLSEGISDELVAEIERVVFEAWPAELRQDTDSFKELLEVRLSSAHARQADELATIIGLSEEIIELRHLRRLEPKLQEDLKSEQRSLAGIQTKIAELTRHADPLSAARLDVVSAALLERQRIAQGVDRIRTSLESLRARVESARANSFPAFTDKLRKDSLAAGLSDEAWEEFSIDFVGDVDGVIDRAIAQVEGTLKSVTSAGGQSDGTSGLDSLTADQLAVESVAVLKAEVDRLQKLVGLDAQRTKQLQSLTASAGDTQRKITRIEQEIARSSATADVDLVERRRSHYRAYFDALLEEEAELRALYRPLDAVLEEFGGSLSKLRFSVKRVVDVTEWARKGEELLDLRREGRFKGEGTLEAVAIESLLDVWMTGTGEEAAQKVEDFSRDYSRDIQSQGKVRDLLTTEYRDWAMKVARWLYSTDHIRLRYSIDYDGVSIERLSPGSRGIVLLLLYLAVDQEEMDPLIIDQPEENLDPESVYTELVRLFRSASSRRQIVMVTHNANLVVNTDVDQVIIAESTSRGEGQLPCLRYTAGGLEDIRIRRAVCEVLEGGAEAFIRRAKRLGMDLAGDHEALYPD